MKVELTNKESEEFFHTALCNGLGYMGGYGLKLMYDSDKYSIARDKLDSPCFEDVLLQILKDGGELTFADIECDEYHSTIGIGDVHEKVQETPVKHLFDMHDERDDAITADCIIQSVFYGEIIFG